VGSYSKPRGPKQRKSQGFAYLDTKSEQYEREKKRSAILRNQLLEKSNEVRRLNKELTAADNCVRELKDIISKLKETVRVQRGIIEDLSEGGV